LFKAKILAAALVALLLTAAASASPGNGNGNGKENGHGPPVSVGSRGGEAKAKGSPPQAAQGQAKKAENAVRKAARRAARANAPAGPERLNPARACKAEREELGDEAFAQEHGTNENGANAFGKCVSAEAEEQSADDPGDEGAEPGTGEPAELGSPPSASGFAGVSAFVRTFLQSIRESF
jgi:hypothetical protein